MRRLLCLLLVALGATLFTATALAGPTNLIVNGDFETGDFTGWSATTTLASPLCDWSVSNCGWFFAPLAPDGGSYFADNGFDGSGPGTYTLSQTVSIPPGTALLGWEDYLGASYSGAARTNDVQILDASGTTTLATVYSYSAPTGSTDTGWVQHSVDLSAFAGQTVTVAFVQTIPENFTGPAEYHVDNIQLLSVAASGGSRVGYCAGTGNTMADGTPIARGTFLNLVYGQQLTDPRYTGATLASFVKGMGISCGAPPAGYSLQGFATATGDAGDLYPYYAP